MSANSIGALNRGTGEKGSLDNIHLSRVTTNSLQPQNVTIIPLNVNCGGSSSGCYTFHLNTFFIYFMNGY